MTHRSTARARALAIALVAAHAQGCGDDAGTIEVPARDGGDAMDAPRHDAPATDAALADGPPADAPEVTSFGAWTSTCSAAAHTDVSNAYPTAFQQAVADDWVTIAWVWRLEPDAATNHSISVARSRDLVHWFNLCGDPVTLPITPSSTTTIDPVPIRQGVLNGKLALSYDAAGRAVVTYQKHIDKAMPDGTTRATTQVFNARLEGDVIRIYQMTSWDGLHEFGGGGSLPPSDTSVSFTGLRVAPSGVLAQALNRSTADEEACAAVEATGGECTSVPRRGLWRVWDTPAGLALQSPPAAVDAAVFASPDPWENPPTASLDVGAVENAPLGPSATAWAIRTLRSRSETRWITLRDDFDGDGANERGLFDRYDSRFFLDDGGAGVSFQFGARDGLLWPLTGDWDGDGRATVGVHDAATGTSFLRNALAGGTADATIVGPVSALPGVGDSPLVWHDANPAARYAIKWEALPANRDLPYSCEGIPLTGATGACTDAARISSNLYLYEYDAAAGAWTRSLIDRAWAGSPVAFDFLTFKNVQLVLYYGADRWTKIAQRVRQGGVWSSWAITTLDSRFGGWDNHNYLTMTIDANHVVHVSGNMHAVPLVYFRGTGFLGRPEPLTYTKTSMTGRNETSVTYPQFLRGPGGTLLFTYRSGSSGAGDTYLDQYDEAGGAWSPLHGSASAPVPLFQGQ